MEVQIVARHSPSRHGKQEEWLIVQEPEFEVRNLIFRGVEDWLNHSELGY